VRAKYVTWREVKTDGTTEVSFYELDRSGKLIGKAGNWAVHHRAAEPSGTLQSKVTEVQYGLFSDPKKVFEDRPTAAFDPLPEFDFSSFTATETEFQWFSMDSEFTFP
jgi:hypothetical protein